MRWPINNPAIKLHGHPLRPKCLALGGEPVKTKGGGFWVLAHADPASTIAAAIMRGSEAGTDHAFT